MYDHKWLKCNPLKVISYEVWFDHILISVNKILETKKYKATNSTS